MSPETVTLKPVGLLRWHVLKPVSEVTDSQQKQATRRGWQSHNPRLIGQIQKQEFISYPRGKPVKRALWFPRTKGGLSAGKPQKTRKAAVEILCAPETAKAHLNSSIK